MCELMEWFFGMMFFLGVVFDLFEFLGILFRVFVVGKSGFLLWEGVIDVSLLGVGEFDKFEMIVDFMEVCWNFCCYLLNIWVFFV